MSRSCNVVETQKFRILGVAKALPKGQTRDKMPGQKSRKAQALAASDSAAKARRGRGRPRQIAEPERRKQLIEAAEHVFVELGYGTASMDDIAHRARMSKKTLYRVFETKEALFAAVIAARRAVLAAMIEARGCDDDRAQDDVLRRFLGQVARFVLAPRQAALYRLVIAESQRAPELAHAFYREGPTKARLALTEWLTLQNERKSLIVPDPACASSMLFSMVIAEPQMCLLIGENREPSEAEIDRRVDRAVEIFLDGARPRDGAKKSAGYRSGADVPVPAK
jgi:AcrR family transcriptional regulator